MQNYLYRKINRSTTNMKMLNTTCSILKTKRAEIRRAKFVLIRTCNNIFFLIASFNKLLILFLIKISKNFE